MNRFLNDMIVKGSLSLIRELIDDAERLQKAGRVFVLNQTIRQIIDAANAAQDAIIEVIRNPEDPTEDETPHIGKAGE